MKITQKLILAFLALGLLPVLLIGSLMYLSTSQALTGQVHRQLQSVAAIQATRIATTMARHKERLAGLTGQTIVQQSLDQLRTQPAANDPAALDRALADVKASSITIREVLVAGPSGAILDSTEPGRVGQSLTGRDYFTAGLRGTDTNNYLYTESNGQTGIYLVSPVTHNNALVGVAIIQADLTTLFTQIQDHSGLGDTGEVALVKQDPAGTGLYLTALRFDAEAALHRTVVPADTNSPFALAQTSAPDVLDSAIDYRAHPVVAAVYPVSSTNWRIMAKIDRTEAYAGLDQLLNTLLVLTFVILVVAVFTALFVSRSTLDPVLSLAAAADRMSKGDLSQRVSVQSQDEFGTLSLAFNNMASGLEKIDQTKSEFVALMSHQLRTPTTAVKGFLAMLIDGYAGKLSPKQTKLLQGAFEENERQVKIINDILLVAAANANQLSISKTPTDLSQIVTDVIASQSAILQEWQQKIDFAKPKTPVLLTLDPEKIRMVIENIVSNAMKYSPQRTTITVILRRAARGITLQVIDQGFGIAPSDTHRLFQKFSRLDNPNSTRAQGSGLGLYLVKKIIELHQGSVELTSEVGKGTTITIRLPTSDAPLAVPAHQSRLTAYDAHL